MPLLLTPEILRGIKSQGDLPSDCYYFVAGVTFAALNRSEELKAICEDAFNGMAQEEQRRIISRIREALIKSAPVVGLPKIIVALYALKAITPPALLDLPSAKAAEAGMRTADFLSVPAQEVLQRGKKFWDTTYQERSEEIMEGLDNVGTPDLGASARLMYSFFLSHEDVLSGKETMFVTMTGMIVTDVQRTLMNHMRGAVHHGATVQEVNAVRDMVVQLCELAGMRSLSDGGSQSGWGWKQGVAKL